MTGKRKIELLAPARDYDTAVAAIDFGADAVYMGAPRFGARYAAGNSIDDISRTVEYAKRFGVRVYTTLNTVLYENELEDAQRTAREVIAAGVDALIVQDMAYMEMGLSGVELHASTQTFNLTPEKVRFMQESGFNRVILERNISLEGIKAIRAVSDVELECFVHGAICVCYSGRCYMSRSMSSRSGNRGDCSQACRLSYDLVDSAGRTLIKNKHLLSVKDLDWSGRIGELIDHGITSFKIEGRLKDSAYVKNVVSWYRRRIDEELALRPDTIRSSFGCSVTDFEPDIAKTFSRGHTEYFYSGRRAGVSSPLTPKALGESLGYVAHTGNGWFEIDGSAIVSAGDGICCISGGELLGTNVNKSEGGRIYPNKELLVKAGTEIFRNYDHKFASALEASRTRRTIDVTAQVSFTENEFRVTYIDEQGIIAEVGCDCCNGTAKESVKMTETITTQLARSGDTMFRVTEVKFSGSVEINIRKDNICDEHNKSANACGDILGLPFLRVSELNALRRDGLEELFRKRMQLPAERHYGVKAEVRRYPYDFAEGSDNIINSMSRRFYQDAGCNEIEQGYDLRGDMTGVTVMRTPFCIRRENGMCCNGKTAEPLHLRHGSHCYRLEFKCTECIMEVVYEGKNR